MTLDEFETSLGGDKPPADCPTALAALWHAARNEWACAHRLVQAAEGTDAAWVHAHLHRVDGDEPNANYWYRRANQPAAQGAPEVERKAIAAALLRGV